MADPLTLDELAHEPNLGLSVLEPGDMSRPVRGAHAIEIEHPAQWLEAEWIMLTTGLRFAGMVDNAPGQEQLIDELADAGVSALLFGVGVHFAEVPSGLVAAARRRRFAILRVSPETPFFVVEDFVNRAVLSSEMHRLQRSLRLNQDLLRTLSADEPVNALISRLGALSNGTAALYDISGAAIASVGAGPLRMIWDEISSRDDAPHGFSVGRWRVASRSFAVDGSRFHVVVASRNKVVIDSLGPDLLETTELILSAANGIRVVTMNQERAEASRLVVALRAGLPTSRVRQTWERLRPFHFRAGSPLRFIAASPLGDRHTVSPRKPAHVLQEHAHLHRLGMVLHEDEAPHEAAPFTALVADQETADAWTEMLTDSHIVGVSGTFSDLTVGAHYYGEALTAWRLLLRRNQSGGRERIIYLDEVDLATWLMAHRDESQVATKVQQQLSPLQDHPHLIETVVTFLACDQDIPKVAEHLFVHTNTVRYRLNKVATLMGHRLNSARLVSNLYLSFQDQVEALRFAGSGSGQSDTGL